AWQGSRAAGEEGHLRLVAPTGTGTSSGSDGASNSESAALKGRVKDLESQLAESRRLLDVRNAELAALQKKMGAGATAPVVPTPAPKPTPEEKPATTPEPATPPSAAQTPTTEPSATPEEKPPLAAEPPKPAPKPVVEEPSGSWLDWISDNWWVPAALVVALLGGLGFAAWKRRQGSDDGEFGGLVDTDVADSRDSTSKLLGVRRGDESFVVEESGQHERPDIRSMAAASSAESAAPKSREGKPSDDTLSSEAAINLDQGDPLAEADFHMAYGLYDQAADLVRIALEREPDRRDLKLKLLEIYFVWGNKDLFLQSAKDLYASRDRAPAGEWEKILIMGKQICPDDALFSKSTGGGMGAGALVDLNLEGGENRVDIDLFGEPEGEQSSLQSSDVAHESSSTAATGEAPAYPSSNLDFVLDAPERGSDESPTREMPSRDEPTVESETFDASNSPTAAWETAEVRARIESKIPQGTEQTAELAIDDLGLDLDSLEQTGAPSLSQLERTDSPSISMDRTGSGLDVTDHPSDAPTMVAGLDEHSRKMMQDAESAVRDRDLTELERELEASFIADLEQSSAGQHTAVIGPESAPTVAMRRDLPVDLDIASTSRVKAPDFSQLEHLDTESTSRLKALSPDASIDLDLDRLANAFSGTGETVDQPRAAEDVFSSEVFEATDRHKGVDLDVGEPVHGHGEGVTTRIHADSSADTNKLKSFDGELPELEPVTMSEVGTKLDLARAYMDMGDPEGARSILEEVAHEGSASQKQEARRLIESLPG
ncbi:MAG: FimV/HubP family polar landmark protein, partial [Casimicrobiaceae bacterium]